jgi:4-amino-4-deoxy-L-arabinose transferase-like glycosyltransferase
MKIFNRHNLNLSLIFFSIVFSLVAQQFLQRNEFFLSGLFFVISIGIMFFALGKKIFQDNRFPVSSESVRVIFSKIRLILGVSAFIFAGISFFLFEKFAATAWILHLLSIVLFLASVLKINLHTKIDFRKLVFTNLPGRIFLFVLISIGAILRFYQIDQMPFGTWFDEADFGLNALYILSDANNFPVYFAHSRVPAYFIYLCALSIKLFGISTVSLRIVSGIFGVLTIWVAYLCGKEMFNQKTALVFAGFIAFSRWNFNWSRIGLDNITIPFFELLVIFLLFVALRSKRITYFALAGLSLGLGLSFYAAMRIFPVVIGLWLITIWIQEKKFLQIHWQGLLVFAVAVIISIVPIAQYSVYHPDEFWGRVKQTSIFNGKTTEEAWQAIGKTTREHLLMFNYQGDRNGRHNLPGDPMLDSISNALMVLGVGISLFRLRNPKYFLILVWWLLMLAPGILSLDFESPQSLRAIGSLPAAYLLAVLPLEEYIKMIEGTSLMVLRKTVIVFIAVLLAFVGYLNADKYFNQQMRSTASWIEFSARETIIARNMKTIGTGVNYYVSSFFINAPTIRFLAPEVTEYSSLETYDLFPLYQEDNRDLVFFIDPDQKMFFELAQKYFPNGKFEEYLEPNGNIILYGIYLTTNDLKSNQGLMATYYPEGESGSVASFSQKETNFAFDWQNHIPLNPPYEVNWEGVLFAHLFGEYRFFSSDPEHSQLVIDGQTVQWSSLTESNTGIILAKGNHAISIQAEAGNGSFALDWQPPDEDLKPLTFASLFVAPVTTNGLLGEYFAGLDWSEPVQYAQIDPSIHFYYHNQPLPRPYTVEWKGRIKIEEPGLYQFALNSIDGSTLYISEKELINNTSPGKKQQEEIFLNSGYYPIRVLYTDQTGYTQISLFWTPPGKDESIIPPEVLFYP